MPPVKKRKTRVIESSNLVALLATLAVIAALAILRSVLEPLVIAFFLSFVAMPFLRFGRRIGLPGPVTVAAIVTGLLIILSWGFSLVYFSSVEFIELIPEYENQMRPYVARMFAFFNLPLEALPQTGEPIPWAHIFTNTPIAGYAGSGIGGFVGWAGELLVVLTFLVFILLDRANGSLDHRLRRAFSNGSPGKDIDPILDQIDHEVERYIQVKAGLSLLTAVLMILVLSIHGVPFAVFFGAMGFVLNFIPNVGSIIATIPPIAVAFIQNQGDFISVLPLTLLLLAVQAGIGNIVDPWLMGRSLSLSPTTVLFSLILWNWLWGIPGMVLAVPTAVVLRIILLRIPDLRFIALLMSDEGVDEDEEPRYVTAIDSQIRQLEEMKEDITEDRKESEATTDEAPGIDKVPVFTAE